MLYPATGPLLVIEDNDEDLRSIPVIVWTYSSDPKDIEIWFRQGANSYMLKPVNTP